MKKTIIALLALGSAASAAELVAEWDGFSSLVSGSYTLNTSGTTSVDENGILSVVGANPASATIDISAAGLSIDNGITINMSVSGVSSWGGKTPYALVSMKGDTTDYLALAGIDGKSDENDVQAGQFAFNGSVNKISMTYPSGTDGDLGCVTDATKYYTLTFTFKKDEFAMYLNGSLLGTGTPNNEMTDAVAKQTVTSIAFGGWAAGSDNGKLNEKVSYFAIYDGAMTAAEVATLVPEPTTATLSLLALAGLAARRRRK